MSESLPPAFDPWFAARCPDIPLAGARAALELAAEGATVPFITRYRKERTGNLDEVAVRRALEAKELFEKILSRQAIIVESIERHATLSPELRERILSTFDLDALEDLYHPYRQQKKNRALAAREAGLEPLADWIWNCGHGTETPQEGQTLELWAFTFRNEEKGVPDAKSAIEGARDILVERLAGDPGAARARAPRVLRARLPARHEDGEGEAPQQVRDATSRSRRRSSSLREPASSHRYLAVRRGQAEDELQVAIGGPPDDAEFEARLVAAFEAAACTVPDSPGAEVLRHAGRIAFKNNVRTSIENEVHRVLKEAADAAAAQVFAENVRRRLLEAPLGPQAGARRRPRHPHRVQAGRGGRDGPVRWRPTSSTSRPTSRRPPPARRSFASPASTRRRRWRSATGRGAARPRCSCARPCARPASTLPVVLVSEAGASVYSTSDAARAEFPDLDATVRGAISIARRLQDPLAELVKIEPRSIGVGQYQHDVAHAALQRALDAVVEDCVNGVGVDLNTASRHLLAHVAGLGPGLAGAIVEHREKQGLFRSRQQLLEVAALRAEGLRAGGRLPARARGREPARRHRGPPRALRGPRGPGLPPRQGPGGAPRPRSRARARGRGARRRSWAPSPGRTSSPSSSAPGGTPGRPSCRSPSARTCRSSRT